MESIKADRKAIRITRLSGEELNEAELTIYRQLQRERYPKAFESLQQDNTIQPKEKIAALLPIWDQRDRLIRVQGRVSLALRDRNIDPPILLPAKHLVISFLITDKHKSLLHAGVKGTLSELKERFWIVEGRQQVKTVWHACVDCQKLTSPPFQELAAPLPLNRLRQAQAFHITGVDFAGPLFYKSAPHKRKAKTLPSVQDSTSADDLAEELAEEPLTEEEAPTEDLRADEEPPIEKMSTIRILNSQQRKLRKSIILSAMSVSSHVQSLGRSI